MDEAHSSSEEKGDRSLTALHGFLAIEFISLLIGLAMPITPSKTGSTTGLADWLIVDPSYLQEVVVYFVLTNLLFVVLGAIAWLWSRFGSSEG